MIKQLRKVGHHAYRRDDDLLVRFIPGLTLSKRSFGRSDGSDDNATILKLATQRKLARWDIRSNRDDGFCTPRDDRLTARSIVFQAKR